MIKSYFFKCLVLLCFALFITPAYSLDLKLTDYNGKSHDLSQDKGKWVIINYWATWCPPCLREIPMLSEYHDSNDNVKIYGIHYEKKISQEKLQDFMDTYLISYPIIPISNELIKNLGDARALPMTIFVSPTGKIVKKYTGMLTKKFLDRIIK